jgi:RHH-type rel operon transcriptional repressor/antitoxin RelB
MRYLYRKKFFMPVSLRLPDDVINRLDALAAKTGRSKTFYMIEAICKHLDELEHLYLAEQRMIDARAGKSRDPGLEN